MGGAEAIPINRQSRLYGFRKELNPSYVLRAGASASAALHEHIGQRRRGCWMRLGPFFAFGKMDVGIGHPDQTIANSLVGFAVGLLPELVRPIDEIRGVEHIGPRKFTPNPTKRDEQLSFRF
jgi:hypothetical protein